MKKSKWMLGAAAMLALSVALAGCGGGDKKADTKAEREFVVSKLKKHDRNKG